VDSFSLSTFPNCEKYTVAYGHITKEVMVKATSAYTYYWKNLLSTAAPAGVVACTCDFKILITTRFQSANKEKNARDGLTKHSQVGKYHQTTWECSWHLYIS
jgi:hypothetical protein